MYYKGDSLFHLCCILQVNIRKHCIKTTTAAVQSQKSINEVITDKVNIELDNMRATFAPASSLLSALLSTCLNVASLET